MKYAISVKKLKAREQELKSQSYAGILASHYDQMLDGVVIKGS